MYIHWGISQYKKGWLKKVGQISGFLSTFPTEFNIYCIVIDNISELWSLAAVGIVLLGKNKSYMYTMAFYLQKPAYPCSGSSLCSHLAGQCILWHNPSFSGPSHHTILAWPSLHPSRYAPPPVKCPDMTGVTTQRWDVLLYCYYILSSSPYQTKGPA